MDQLLDVMKIDEQKLTLNKERKSIAEIINDCIRELSYQIHEKKHKVIIDIKNDFFLTIDPERIFQVFTNLISNSIKFSPEYGKIIITSQSDQPDYSITFNAAFQTQDSNRNYKNIPLNYQLGIH